MNKDSLIRAFTIKRNHLRHTAAMISGDRNADDILQEAFCNLWSSAIATDIQGNEDAISMATVRNKSIDTVRQQQRHHSTSLDEGISTRLTSDDSSALVEEKFQNVRHIIEEQLSASYRDVLWMRDYEGLSFAEIAEERGTTEANIRQILSRARKQVRDIYRQNKSNEYE